MKKREILVKFPEQYHAEDLQGKPAKFKVKIQKILKASTPPIDDELAKKNKKPEADTLDELKAKITEEIEKSYEAEKEKAKEKAILDKLIAESKISEISEQLLLTLRQRDYEQMAALYQVPAEKINEIMQHGDIEKDKAGIKERVLSTMVVQAIVEKESFEHTEEEIEAEWQKLKAQAQLKDSDKDAYVDDIRFQLSAKKAKDLLIDSTNISFDTVSQDEYEKSLEAEDSKATA